MLFGIGQKKVAPATTTTTRRMIPDKVEVVKLPTTVTGWQVWKKPGKDEIFIVRNVKGGWTFLQLYLCSAPDKDGVQPFPDMVVLAPYTDRNLTGMALWEHAQRFEIADVRRVVSMKEVVA
jgi:hypothetical protein